jgi:capsule biosynthesis phosphatase
MHRGWRIDEMISHAGYDGIEKVELERTTRGPAETLLLGLEGVDNCESVLVLDCDVLHPRFVVETSQALSCGAIFCFDDKSQTAIFSYVSCDDAGRVVDIAEKNKISDRACSGAYFFPNASELKSACKHVIRMGESSRGEYYISNVISRMLNSGKKFIAPVYEPYKCLGTPEQLREACSFEQRECNDLRLCFDLDGTLVSHPRIRGDYSTVDPIHENIEFLRMAKDRGAYIIIHTARRMKTHKGNVSKVIEDIGNITRDTLVKFNIPHDELVFGKPYAHFYIDDFAVPAWSELEKWIGIYPKTIVARRHNTVDIRKDHVIKHCGNDGEVYFYSNMPTAISKFFPSIISILGNTITMEKIEGHPASNLYASGEMTFDDIYSILECLIQMHSSMSIFNITNMNLCANYTAKINERMKSYDFISIGMGKHISSMLSNLAEYESSNRIRASVIHGDPVFSNVFIGRSVKFIDPRGKLGNQLSIFGDRLYDLGKVYQSISGYDSIILGKDYPTNRNELIERYEEWIMTVFGAQALKDVRLIASSLLASLLPMHDNANVPKFVSLYEEMFT